MARSEVRRIRLSDIIPDPNNPRKNFDEEKLESLAASFVANGGEPFIPPIVVPCGGGKYHIADGERRYRAMVMAGQVEEASFIVSEDADEAYSLASMLATDLKEPLSSEEKAVGVQQALMYGMDLGTVDAVASIPRGSAEKVKQVIEYRDDPVQTSLDALFKIAEIDGTLERDQLLDLAEDPKKQDRFYKELGKARSLQKNRKVREEMIDILDSFGVGVTEQAPVAGYKKAISVHGNVDRLGSFLSGNDDRDGMIATVTQPDGKLTWTKDGYESIECIVYVPVEETDDEDSIVQAERDARKEEFNDELEGILSDWRGFLFSSTLHPESLADGLREQICSCWNTRFEVTEAEKKGYPSYSDVPEPYMFPFVLSRFMLFNNVSMNYVETVYVNKTKNDYYLERASEYLDLYDLALSSGYEPHDFERKLTASLRELTAGEEDESAETDAITCEECVKCDE